MAKQFGIAWKAWKLPVGQASWKKQNNKTKQTNKQATNTKNTLNCFWAPRRRGRKRRPGQLWYHVHSGKKTRLQAFKNDSDWTEELTNKSQRYCPGRCQKTLKFFEIILISFDLLCFQKCSFSKTQNIWEQSRGYQFNWVKWDAIKGTFCNFQASVILYKAEVITAQEAKTVHWCISS